MFGEVEGVCRLRGEVDGGIDGGGGDSRDRGGGFEFCGRVC